MGIPKQLSMLAALTNFLMFFKSCKIITFSHINSTNFNNNFKDNFMREKVNKKAPKAKTLNISALEPNWKWINDSLILSRKKHDAIPNFNQHWSILININNAVIYVFSPFSVWERSQIVFWWLLLHHFRLHH